MIRLSRGYEYAVIVMTELARVDDPQKYYPLKKIAGKHPVSPKYLDRIAFLLAHSGLIEATNGLGGGYRLVKSPSKYTLLEILQAVDNTSADTPLQDGTLGGFMQVWSDAKIAFKKEFSATTLDELAACGSSGGDIII